MPGRPRTTLKLLNELLRRAEAYGSKLYDLTPRQYVERPNFDDPTCVAWQRARQAAVANYQAVEELRDQIAEKLARGERSKRIVESGQ